MPSASFEKGTDAEIARLYSSAIGATVSMIRDSGSQGFPCLTLWECLRVLDPEASIEVFNTIEEALLASGAVRKSNDVYYWIEGKSLPSHIIIAVKHEGGSNDHGGSRPTHNTGINLN